MVGRPEPVELAEVTVRGYRTVLDATLRPGRLTVLVGEANAGKSNLLAAIRTLLDPTVPPSPADTPSGTTDLPLVLEGRLANGTRLGPGHAVPDHVLPPVLFLPSELRSGPVVAPGTDRGEGARAAELLTGAVAERVSPHPRYSPATPATGIIPGLERCCRQGVQGVVLLIEEPELYLRPQSQRYLYRVLRDFAAGGNQVFYSTSSPAFLNVARLEDLVLVTRDPAAGTRILRPEPLPEADEFRIMSEFDAERSELFLAQAAVLVEGRTEKLALPYVFSALGWDSDRSGISIVECGGKGNIVVLARVCRAVGVPFVAVHDRDAPAGRQPSLSERNLNRLIAEIAGPENTVVLVPDFEGVSALRRKTHKPEQAWRRFRSVGAEDIPDPLARVARRAMALAGPEEHRFGTLDPGPDGAKEAPSPP